MTGGVIIPDKETAKALNELARQRAITRLLSDIRIDMEICEIKGWDKKEYLAHIKRLIDSIGAGALRRMEENERSDKQTGGN